MIGEKNYLTFIKLTGINENYINSISNVYFDDVSVYDWKKDFWARELMGIEWKLEKFFMFCKTWGQRIECFAEYCQHAKQRIEMFGKI